MYLGFILFVAIIFAQRGIGKWVLAWFKIDEQKLGFLAHVIGWIFVVFMLLLSYLLNLKYLPAALVLVGGLFYQSKKFTWHVNIGWPLVLTLFCGLPILLQSLMMGFSGAYAPYFFNVDTPFSLMVINSVTKADAYPPLLLDNLGSSLPYHYGIYAYGSFLTRLTGFNATSAYTLLVVPYTLFLTLYTTFHALSYLSKIKPWVVAIGVVVIWFSFQQYFSNVFNGNTFSNMMFTSGYYWAVYPKAVNFLPYIFTVVLVVLVYAKSDKELMLAAVVIGLGPLFKVTMLPFLLTAFSVYLLVDAFVYKRLYRLFYAGAALSITLAVYFIFSNALSGNLQLSFGITAINRHFVFSFAGAVLMGLAIWFYTLKFQQVRPIKIPVYWMAFLGSFPLILVAVKVVHPDSSQLFYALPFAAFFLLVAWVLKNWRFFTGLLRKMVALCFATLMILPLLNWGYFSSHIVNNPSMGQDYCNNRLLAETLKEIPIDGSILATNDLRYPADNFARPDIQTQFAGLFGHQMMVSNLNYLISGDDKMRAARFMDTVRLYRADSERLMVYLKQKGVTHYIEAELDSSVSFLPVVGYKLHVVR